MSEWMMGDLPDFLRKSSKEKHVVINAEEEIKSHIESATLKNMARQNKKLQTTNIINSPLSSKLSVRFGNSEVNSPTLINLDLSE